MYLLHRAGREVGVGAKGLLGSSAWSQVRWGREGFPGPVVGKGGRDLFGRGKGAVQAGDICPG